MQQGHVSYTYRHGDFGELLADAVLHDAPQIEGVVGLVWDTSPPLSAGLQLLPCHIITAWRHLGLGAGEENLTHTKFEKYFQLHGQLGSISPSGGSVTEPVKVTDVCSSEVETRDS